MNTEMSKKILEARAKLRKTIFNYAVEVVKENEGLEKSFISKPYNKNILKIIEKYGDKVGINEK